MMRIHNNEVKNTAEWNLLHDIINLNKCANIFNSHCSPFIHVCMNTRKGKSKFKTFASYLKVDVVLSL